MMMFPVVSSRTHVELVRYRSMQNWYVTPFSEFQIEWRQRQHETN